MSPVSVFIVFVISYCCVICFVCLLFCLWFSLFIVPGGADLAREFDNIIQMIYMYRERERDKEI